MTQSEKALETYAKGFNCAQAVCSAFCEKYGIDEQTALRFAGSFGGGMRCGEVCGAVSGALMIIGLPHAQRTADDKERPERCGPLTVTFMERYENEKGALRCRDLLGYDVRDREAKAKNPNRTREVCPGAIEAAVLLLEEMGL